MADFQHRHYAHVAALLAKGKPGALVSAEVELSVRAKHMLDQWECMVSDFANMFAKDNDRFDYSRFLDAAQGNPTNKDRSTARRRMGFVGAR